VSDLVTCPKCGLSQSARHAFCARCDYSFDGPATADMTPSASSMTPTDEPEGTPTDLPPAPPPLPSKLKSPLDETAESPEGDTVEEALPDAPSWDLPNRPTSSNPGRPRTETARARAPGLSRDRGSLAQRMSSGSIDKLPDARPPVPPELPASDPGRGKSGDLRGRPPSSLYASENSAPPGDPLMAALVSGDDLGMAPPPPDILADDLVKGHPPVHRTDPEARNLLFPDGPPSDADFSGPRVVPPRPTRRSTGSSASHKSIRRDPRGRPVASAPVPRGGILPDAASSPGTPARSAPVPPAPAPAPSRPGNRPPIGRTGGVQQPSRPGWPGGSPGGTGSASARDIPLPPPPTDLGRSRREPVDLKGVAARALVIVLTVVLVWAAWDVWQLFSNLGTLNGVVTVGNTATPDLVGELDEQVRVLGLEDQVTERWASISGETDTYSIGVDVRHAIVFVPVHFTAHRDGPFRVSQRLATLDYFIANGWELDGTAAVQHEAYVAQKNQRAPTPAPPPAPVLTPDPEGEQLPEEPAEGGG